MKIKTKDGQEVEVSDTFFLENDEAFTEAARMRGVKLPKAFGGGENTADLEARIAAIVDQRVKQNEDAIRGLISKLDEEKKVREQATAEVQKQIAGQRSEAIKSALESAVKSGKIPPANADKWKARLEKDYETQLEILNELPGNPAVQKTAAPEKTVTAQKVVNPANDYISNHASYMSAAEAAFSAHKAN